MVKKNTTENELTTLKVMKTTRDRVAGIGFYNETMDDIVVRLLDFYEDKKTQQIIDEKSEPATGKASQS